MRYVDDPRCFEMLANAIVKQAAEEYRNASLNVKHFFTLYGK